MGAKESKGPLPPELAETLARMDKAYAVSAAGLPSLEGDPEYVQICLETELVDQALRAMRADSVSRAELARRMNVSRTHVTNLLNEAGNVTLETIAKLAVALERDVALRLIRKTEKVTVETAQLPAYAAERWIEGLKRARAASHHPSYEAFQPAKPVSEAATIIELELQAA